jgi:hypothetical protein
MYHTPVLASAARLPALHLLQPQPVLPGLTLLLLLRAPPPAEMTAATFQHLQSHGAACCMTDAGTAGAQVAATS